MRDAAVKGPRRSLWRSHCLACVGAVLLIVWLAAVGMPARSSGWMGGNWIASQWIAAQWITSSQAAGCEERLARPPHSDTLPLPLAVRVRQAQVLHLPRVMPRFRSVLERGLPPPRAPCA